MTAHVVNRADWGSLVRLVVVSAAPLDVGRVLAAADDPGRGAVAPFAGPCVTRTVENRFWRGTRAHIRRRPTR